MKGTRSTLFWLVCFSFVYRGLDSGAFSAVNRMLTSAAQVTESASSAASMILDKSSALAEGTAGAVEASMTVAKAAWNGIDLADVKVNRSRVQIRAMTSQALRAWIHSEESEMMFPDLPANTSRLWLAAIDSLSWQRSDVFLSRDELDMAGFFWSSSAHCFRGQDGWLVLDVTAITLSFSPRWSNPAWELLECDLSTEYMQVHMAAVATVLQHDSFFDVEQIVEADQISLFYLLCGYGWQCFRSLWQTIFLVTASGWGVGLMLLGGAGKWYLSHHPAFWWWPRASLVVTAQGWYQKLVYMWINVYTSNVRDTPPGQDSEVDSDWSRVGETTPLRRTNRQQPATPKRRPRRQHPWDDSPTAIF